MQDFPTEDEMASDPKKMAKAIAQIRAALIDRDGRPLSLSLVETQRRAAGWTGFGLGLVYGILEIAKHFIHIP